MPLTPAPMMAILETEIGGLSRVVAMVAKKLGYDEVGVDVCVV